MALDAFVAICESRGGAAPVVCGPRGCRARRRLGRAGASIHDAGHPFAGSWTISFQINPGSPGTFSFGLVGDSAGLAAMNQIFATNPCEEPSDYYTGTFSSGGQSGPLAGCTTGADDRSIFARYGAGASGTGTCRRRWAPRARPSRARTTSTRSGMGCSRSSDRSKAPSPVTSRATAPERRRPLGGRPHPAGQRAGGP